MAQYDGEVLVSTEQTALQQKFRFDYFLRLQRAGPPEQRHTTQASPQQRDTTQASPQQRHTTQA